MLQLVNQLPAVVLQLYNRLSCLAKEDLSCLDEILTQKFITDTSTRFVLQSILDFAIIWISSCGVSLSLNSGDLVNLALSGPAEKDEVIQFNYLTESWDKNSQWCCLLLMFLILAIGI